MKRIPLQATALVLSLLLLPIMSTNAVNDISKNNKESFRFSTVSYKELIIQIPDLTEKNYEEIVKGVESAGGVVFKGYCPSLHVLMFLFDTDIHADTEFLNETLPRMGYSYEIKIGADIAQVINACGSGVIIPGSTGNSHE